MEFMEFIVGLKTPILILMGFAIVYLVVDIRDKNKIIKEKDEKLTNLAEKTIAVISALDVKTDVNTKDHEELMGLARETRDDVKQINSKI